MMASIVRVSALSPIGIFGVTVLPTERGRWMADSHSPVSRQRLATDSLGNTTMTLTNVVVGSRIRIELQGSGALVDERTATGATEVFSLPYYAPGDVANDLRIKVRKGTSAPKYQPFETQATASEADQSIYVAQVADPIA